MSDTSITGIYHAMSLTVLYTCLRLYCILRARTTSIIFKNYTIMRVLHPQPGDVLSSSVGSSPGNDHPVNRINTMSVFSITKTDTKLETYLYSLSILPHYVRFVINTCPGILVTI